MKTKKVVKFLDPVLQAMMRVPDEIAKGTYCEVLMRHNGDDAGGTLDSGRRNLR